MLVGEFFFENATLFKIRMSLQAKNKAQYDKRREKLFITK